MPEQQQIFDGAVAAAPKDYTLAANVEFVLKCVNASFTDNGAAGDWLPAVVLVSDSGHVIGRGVDQGVKVTAGSDAEVSWFPGVKHAAAAASGTTLAFARAWNDSFSGDSAQSIPAGATRNGSFAHAETTDASVISWSTSVFSNDTATLAAHGTYLMFVGAHWDVVDVNVSSEIQQSGAGVNAFPHTPINPNTVPAFGDGVGSAVSQDFAAAHVTTGGYTERILHNNRLGTSQAVQQCYFVIVYLGTG